MVKVDRDFLVKNLQEFIRIPSLSGDEERMAIRVAEVVESLGLKATLDKYNNVIVEVGKGKRSLMLNAHLDTVPPGDGWSFNPFSGVVKNGKIYGRGASDNKNGVVAILEILRQLSEHKLNGKLIALFTSMEEGGKLKKDARLSLIEAVKAESGICLDHYIDSSRKICEIIIGCRGIVNLELTIYGKAYHASEPEKGDNAIYKALDFVNRLRTLRLDSLEKPLPVHEDISVTKIHGGEWATMVPDKCTVTVNYRFLPNKRIDEAYCFLDNLAKEMLSEAYELRKLLGEEGYMLDLGGDLINHALRTSREQGYEAKLSVARGWVDSSFFTNRMKVPTICLGVGTKGTAHTKDEYININDLVDGTKIVLGTVLRYFS